MSTHCRIIVETAPEDRGRTLSFEPSELPPGRLTGVYDDTAKGHYRPVSVTTQPVRLRRYVSIYCHADGYPDAHGAGTELLTKYADYETALNLVLLGDVGCITAHPFEQDMPSDPESDGYVTPCAVTNDWNDCKPMTGAMLPDEGEEYLYLFSDGKWEVWDQADGSHPGYGRWNDLAEYSHTLAEWLKNR